MTWVVDQTNLGTNASTGSAATIVLTTANPVASGALAVLVVGWFNASVTLTSVTGGSVTWSLVQANNSGVRATLAWAPCPSGIAASTAITANFSGSTSERKIGGSSFTGGANTLQNSTTNTGSSGAYSVGPTVAGGALVVGAISVDANNVGTPDANTTETQDFAAGTASRSYLVYRIGGTPVGGTMTSVAWAAAGASFDDSGGGGGGTSKVRRALMGVGY